MKFRSFSYYLYCYHWTSPGAAGLARAKSGLECWYAGNVGIGHVRYPTAGTASASEAQPFFVNSPLGIYLIHNGNLTNCEQLRETLNSSQSFFNRHLRTDSDSEVGSMHWAPSP